MGFEDAQIKIPVAAVIVTKNEGPRLERCLARLSDFAEIFIVDSADASSGGGQGLETLADKYEAAYVPFTWNGRYPKKRQWCLEHLPLSCDWVFFIDADEVMTASLLTEVRGLDFKCAGYFVPGVYVWDGAPLRYGLRNNKLALINRRHIEFPVVGDLEFEGMGEIEGHYQPVLKPASARGKIGRLRSPLLHYAYEDQKGWQARHEAYARWYAAMDRHKAWPREPVFWRRVLKSVFGKMPCRAQAAFLHSYILKQGFRDGDRGKAFARSRARFYGMIARAGKARAHRAAAPKAPSARRK